MGNLPTHLGLVCLSGRWGGSPKERLCEEKTRLNSQLTRCLLLFLPFPSSRAEDAGWAVGVGKGLCPQCSLNTTGIRLQILSCKGAGKVTFLPSSSWNTWTLKHYLQVLHLAGTRFPPTCETSTGLDWVSDAEIRPRRGKPPTPGSYTFPWQPRYSRQTVQGQG